MRDGWDEIEAEKTRLLRRMTVEESLDNFIALQRTFEPKLQQAESLFRAERRGIPGGTTETAAYFG